MVSPDELQREQERDRGVLNDADRKWLLTDRDAFVQEYSRQYWGQRRDAVQNRVENAVLDFSLLVDELPGELLQDALALEDVDGDPAEALPALVSFLYQFYGSEYQLERLVEAGVERVRRDQGDTVKARAEIDLFPDELAELEQRLDEDGVDAVDHRELEDLWNAGELTDDEYITLVERWQTRWEPDRHDDVTEDLDVAEYEHGARRQVVHGAVNRAKRNVEQARRREESREEMYDELGIDTQTDGEGEQ